MIKSGTFYLLPQNIHTHNISNYIKYIACYLTMTKWRIGKSILITCDTKSIAKKIDEALWIIDKNAFLPHNLFTHNNDYSPIIIYWPQYYYNNTKHILINLMQKNMNFFFNFNEIIDFVPSSEKLKKLARNRYRSYKNIGFQLNIVNLPIT